METHTSLYIKVKDMRNADFSLVMNTLQRLAAMADRPSLKVDQREMYDVGSSAPLIPII